MVGGFVAHFTGAIWIGVIAWPRSRVLSILAICFPALTVVYSLGDFGNTKRPLAMIVGGFLLMVIAGYLSIRFDVFQQ